MYGGSFDRGVGVISLLRTEAPSGGLDPVAHWHYTWAQSVWFLQYLGLGCVVFGVSNIDLQKKPYVLERNDTFLLS